MQQFQLSRLLKNGLLGLVCFLAFEDTGAQVKHFRQLKTVDVLSQQTLSTISLTIQESAKTFAAKMSVAKNSTTGVKDIVEYAMIRGASAKFEDPVYRTDAAGKEFVQHLSAVYKDGANTVKVKINENGEFSNAEYTYSGTNTKVKIIGNASGVIEGSVSYSTATTPTSYGGGITITSDGGTITGLSESLNFKYASTSTGLTYTFEQKNTFTFSNDDMMIWFIFGINF